MSVVGFDLGNLSSYIAIAKGGGIETIVNEHSDRMTPSVVSYSGQQRSQGQEAKSQMVTNPKNTISQFKRFIGRKFNDPAVQEEIQRVPYNVKETNGGGIGIQVQYQNEEEVFSPEQVTATFLTKLRSTTESILNTKVTDCVISVPQYYTDAERRAVLGAASISGLNCLRVMNDTTAAALAYGIYKQDLPTPEEKPRNVVFVDFGHASLQVAICAFNKGTLKMLSTASDRSLGGRDFDQVICEHLAKDFLAKFKIDIKSNVRARLRTMVEAEKLKKLMSANATRIPVNIESLMNDIDVRSAMQRSDFEALAADLLKRVEIPLKSALEQAKLKNDDIFSIEIIGGSTRIPFVKDIIKSVFKKSPSTTLNQDEAVSRGCALQCAILSPTFRVREFTVKDVTPYSIKLTWSSEKGDSGESVVFKRNDETPFTRMLTFYRSKPFTLDAYYSEDVAVPYPDTFIGKFMVKNVTPNESGESSKIKVKVNISRHGIFSVSSAAMVVKVEVPDPPKEDEKTEEPDNPKEEGDKMETTSETQGTEEAQQGGEGEDTKMESEESKSDEKEANQTEADATDEGKDQKEGGKDQKEGDKKEETEEKGQNKNTKNKVKYTSKDLPIDAEVHDIPQKEQQDYHEKEMKMIQNDKQERDRSSAKNSVEEYVYEIRAKLYDNLENFITEEERSEFSSILDKVEDWLYGEGEDLQKTAYVTKLEELKKRGDPVVKRETESIQRPHAFEELGRALQLYRKFVDKYNAGDEEFNHIEKSEIEKVEKCISDKTVWHDEKLNKQNQVPLTQDPIVLVSEIRTATTTLIQTCDPVTKTPKPKVEPPKEEPPKDEGETTGTANTEEENMETDQTTTEEGTKVDGTPMEDPAQMEVD